MHLYAASLPHRDWAPTNDNEATASLTWPARPAITPDKAGLPRSPTLSLQTTNLESLTTYNIMPKIFEYFGFIFFFYSMEHEPIHVHVLKSGVEAVFDLIIEDGELKDIVYRQGKTVPMNEKDRTIAEAFVRKYYRNIIEKWINFFVYKKRIRSTKISKKL